MNIKNKFRGLKEIWQFDNHWYLALTRILFPGEKIQFYRYKGLEILIDHSAGDANGAREVLTSDMYRRYLKEIDGKKNLTVLDLGANNGGFPLLLKSEGFEIERLVCVELNPKTSARLRFNLDKNFDNIFTVLNCAVTGEKRRLQINLGTGGAGDNIYRNKGADAYSIQGLDFDEIYQSAIGEKITDICKMDVEGAEFEIFSNTKYDCIKKCRFLLMEIHHEKATPRNFVLEKLKQMNFSEIGGDSKNDEMHYVHFFKNESLQN
jgi:FkbM family methyltransferase